MQACYPTWETCFADPPEDLEYQYQHLLHLVESVRETREYHGTFGAHFAFDRATNDSTVGDYQRKLAALLAITLPVGDEQNPFNMAVYRGSGGRQDSLPIDFHLPRLLTG